MQCLWETSPLAAEDIIGILDKRQDWQEATVKTLLNRLLKKGAIRAQKDGRRFIYSAVLKRDQWLTLESNQFLSRLFDGKLAPFIAHFQSQKNLSKADITSLKKLIEDLDHD